MINSKIQVYKGSDNSPYYLPLEQPVGFFKNIDIEKNTSIKEKLESFTSFEEKLEYFNTNLRSLSLYSMDGRIYFEWGNPDQTIKIYCGCKDCRNKEDFLLAKEQTFFKLREKEVNRILKGLKTAKTYQNKLKFIFEVCGYRPDIVPRVFNNIPFDPSIDADRAMHVSIPAIDLTPKTKEETNTYNEFVQRDFSKKYKSNTDFSENYKCFNSNREIERLNFRLSKSLDPHNLLLYIKNKILTFFNYPKCLEERQESNIVREINQQLNQQSLGDLLVAKMILGTEIDLNRIVVDEHELLRYTHAEEIVKFYKYVEERIAERSIKAPVEVEYLPGKMNFTDLVSDNPKYERLKKNYYDRLKISLSFSDKKLFIIEEIKNVETEYTQPGTSDPGHLISSFSLEEFRRLSFESLKLGYDRNIARHVNRAKLNYLNYRKISRPEFNEIDDEEELNRIGYSAFVKIEDGVGFLLYYKFLTGELNSIENAVPVSSPSNGSVSECKTDINANFPVFKDSSIEEIYQIIKPYFINQSEELLQVLKTGYPSKEKLVFVGSAKVLLDFFKQLHTGQFLTVSTQAILESWIIQAFSYLHNGKANPIIPKYANKIISGSERAAKGNRIIDVKVINGKFEIHQAHIQNRKQH